MPQWDAQTAEWYAANYGEYATNRLAVDALDLAPAVVLDVGCGTGAALRHASERWPDATLIGVDPVPRMVEIAQERLVAHPRRHAIEIRQGAAESIPVDDSSVDVVLAFDSFDHWNDRQAGAREVSRVLRPGGRLVVVKDAGVPQEEGDAQAMKALFRDEGKLELASETRIEAEGVAFTLSVFAPP